MEYLLVAINIGLLIYILAIIKDKKSFSTGMKVLLGFGIFFSFGSLSVLISPSYSDTSNYQTMSAIESSIISTICYGVYIYNAKFKNKLNERLKDVNKQTIKHNSYTTVDGILVDDADDETIVIYRPLGDYMTIEDAQLIDKHELPHKLNTSLILKNDEYCCFVDNSKTQRSKTVTKGYERNSNSVRVLGTSWRTGGGTTKAIREEEITNYYGTIYITNKRIIYTSQGGESFDKKIEDITSIREAQDGVIIQIGSKTHLIILSTHVLFMQVLNLIKNKEYGIPLPETAYNEHIKYTIDPHVIILKAENLKKNTPKKKKRLQLVQ